MRKAYHLFILCVIPFLLRAQTAPEPRGDPDRCYCPVMHVELTSTPSQPLGVCIGTEIEVCANVYQDAGKCSDTAFIYPDHQLEYHWEVLNVQAHPQSGKTACARFKVYSHGRGEVVFSVTGSMSNPTYCHQSVSTSLPIHVYTIDVDVDSDNNDGFNIPLNSEHEENLEAQPGNAGKIMVVNNGDVDLDGVPNFADGFGLFGQTGGHAGGLFVPVVIRLPTGVLLDKANVILDYPEASPLQTSRTGDGSRRNPFVYSPGAGRIRLWRYNGSAARSPQDVRQGGHYIKSGVAYPVSLLGNSHTVVAYMEAVNPSMLPGDIRISATVDPDGPLGAMPWICGDTATATSVKIELGVDLNRDRVISSTATDVTTPRFPYRFWLNNDRDEGNGHEAGDVFPTPESVDLKDEVIGCMRDLEDFFPLQVRFEGPAQILQMIGTQTINAGLKARPLLGSPSQRMFRSVDQNGSFAYLDQLATARQQALDPLFRQAVGTISGLGRFNFVSPTGEWLLRNISSTGGRFCMLLESTGSGRTRYSADLFINNRVIGEGGFAYIESQDIRKMYEHWTVGDDTTTDVAGIPDAASEINGFRYSEYSPESSDYILFVHGWRMRPWERRHFAETAYKRLFWSRYDGRFGLFSWPTDYADNLVVDPRNYDRSEYRAWRSAPALRNLIIQLNGASPGKMHVLAHSMGNVVASEALRLEAESDFPDMIVRGYAASQAASVAHAYDGVLPSIESDLTTDSPESYANYPPTGRPYFASIGNAAGEVINLFNEQDHALGWWLYNQDVKPDFRYDYEFVGLDLSRRHWTHNPSDGEFRILDFPADTHEIYSFIAEARSKALGAEPSMRGSINRYYNLGLRLGYGSKQNEHSGQFNSIASERLSYWINLVTMFDASVVQ